MDRASDAVPSQITNHGESIAPHLALNHSSNLRNPKSGPRHQHSFRKSPLRACHQALALFRYFAHRNGYRGIRHESIFLDGNIEFDQIAWFEHAFAWNSMNSFIVEADAVHPREPVNQCGSRTCSVLPHHARAHFV